MPDVAYRLPTTVRPRHYDVALDARLDSPAFRGHVAIQIAIAAPTRSIELHARSLALTRATLDQGERSLEGMITLDPAIDLARVEFREAVMPGEGTLRIAFAGQVNLGLEGLYRATDGPEELLCSQCEATAARTIFPCFDEPAFKAQFAFEVTTAPAACVLTNTPLISRTAGADGQSQVWRFAASAPMSSYLVGLVIGDVAATREAVVNRTPLRIWAMRGKEALGEFALSYTGRLLPWFEDYFATPYHFTKYDQVAVPGFAAGAMENSGLVLFRQTLLLMNPQTASWQNEKAIATVIAHEFAHQWFGNLVTMAWWDDIWLNEAFAEWMAFRVVDALDPGYAIWLDFQRNLTGALAEDALEATHPIYTPVATAGEAEDLFDSVTYAKGCGVLRMLEQYVGAAAFRQGIRTYVAEFAEGNARSADLWRHLAAAAEAPVADIMESWNTQSGYPVLHLALACEGPGVRVQVRQERFFACLDAPPSDSTWRVPIVIRYADETGVHERHHLLTGASAEISLPVTGALAWYYPNAGQTGFYRARLDAASMNRLHSHLGTLDPAEQIGLLDDQWALVQNGRVDLHSYLDLVATLAGTTDYAVLQQVVDQLANLNTLAELTGDRVTVAGFRAWVAGLFEPHLAVLGFAPQPRESREAGQMRAALVEALAVIARTPAALAAARAAAEQEAVAAESIDANLASRYLTAVAQEGDAATFDHYLATYEQRRAAGAAPQETDRYLYGFLGFEDAGLVTRLLDLLDAGTLPRESLIPLITQMLARPAAGRAAWAFLKTHWDTMQSLSALSTPLVVAASGRLPADLRPDVVAFFEQHLQGLAPLSYARALETLDQQAALQRYLRAPLQTRFGTDGSRPRGKNEPA